VDTTAGKTAYSLATTYSTELAPRLPADLVSTLAADLKTLGVVLDPAPAGAVNQTSSSGQILGAPQIGEHKPAVPAPSPPPPPFAEAMAKALGWITAVRAALHGAGAKAALRRAYGVSGSRVPKDADAVVATGEKIVERAKANPSEALACGILPDDVTALVTAMAELTAAEEAAKATSGAGLTGKETRVVAARIGEAVARIGGAGVLAFANNTAVRAEFEPLLPARKVTGKGKAVG